MPSLLRRLRARRRLKASVGLWYHPEYAPASLSRTSRVPELPLDRVERAVGQLDAEGTLRPGDLRSAPLASFEALSLVHTPRYLEAVTEPETLAQIFALEPSAIETDALLLAQRRAVGGTVRAALATAGEGFRVGFNLGGGFHHAEPDRGGGFCVFNDVAVAVAVLRQEGFQAPVAVVDLDFHQGNGNIAAFAKDPSVLTYSIQGSVWSHAEATANQEIVLPSGTTDREYLARLRATLPEALERHRPRLIFYVAGNDVLAGDRLGDFALTPAGALERDRFVVESARSAGAGLVITLAGGYGPNAWRCTTNLVRWLLTGVAIAEELESEHLRGEFSRIARRIDPIELQRGHGEPAVLTEADVLRDLSALPAATRVLGYYSAHGVEYAFERYGILAKLRKKGFSDLKVSVDPSDPEKQIVGIHGAKREAGSMPALLMELFMRRRRLPPGAGLPATEVLFVEWLLLQDPTASFTLERPPLPGQEHPGLGIAREIQELLVQACHRLGLDGMGSRPSHYHHAVVASRDFRFLDPVAEGRFLAIRQVLSGFDLAEATVLMEKGALRTRDGTVFEWEPADHVLPVSPRLKSYFSASAYVQERDAAQRRFLELGLHLEPTFHNSGAAGFSAPPRDSRHSQA